MKTTLLSTLLATAVSAAFATAPATAQNTDTATYQNVIKKAAADYKVANASCTSLAGNAKSVCAEEAKAVRAHAEADAVAQYNNTAKGRVKARTAAANAEFSLAKAKCGDMTGADKTNCVNSAATVHTVALSDAKADRTVAASTTTTGDATKAAAVDKCAQIAGQPKTGCLIDNRASTTTTTTTTTGVTTAAPGTVAERTAAAVDNAADNTRSAATTVVEKTKEIAATAADKTRTAAASIAGKTDRATDNVQDQSADAARKTGTVVADSVITTKVKADIFKEPELKSMAIHVETEKGVVMLSGFVDSKSDAEKAVRLAKGVEGVTTVKSAIKVK